MIKVLFVCLGNICRSPLAEAIFNHLIDQENLSNQFSSDSCGTAGYHIGASPDYRSVHVAQKHQVPISSHARKLEKNDLEKFDYIIPMDDQNKSNILALDPEKFHKVLLMRSFDDLSDQEKNVPDPYYGSAKDFQEVYNMLDRSNKNFISFLKEKHQ